MFSISSPNTIVGFHKQQGTATAEMAILLPVLFLMLFVAGEMGRFLGQYNELMQANRDAVRYVAHNAATDAPIIDLTDALKNEAASLLVYGAVGGGASAILPNLTTGDVAVTSPDADHVQISVTYTFTPSLGTRIPGFGPLSGIDIGVDMTSTVVMRAM